MGIQLRVGETVGKERVKRMLALLAGGLLDALETQSRVNELLEELYYDGLK